MRSTIMAFLAAAQVATAPAALAADQTTVDWKMCRDVAKDWSPEDDRTECTMVTVPMDYARPDGRALRIAVSRIKATDPGRRRGVIVFNPGGPGQAGIEQPGRISESEAAGLGREHDLIGFDPRGVQYSEDVACPREPGDTEEPPPGLSEEDKARFVFERDAKVNRRCAALDPAFVRSLTTDNIARDVDRIRIALGEPKIGFYGVSWGTALGASYRSLFDRHVDRMLLDSVMTPTLDMSTMDDGQVAAGERSVHDFADWLAARDAEYRFGTTQEAVLAALIELRHKHGDEAVQHLAGPRAHWPRAARALAALRDGGQAARAGSFGWETTPNGGNTFQQTAVLCNSATGARDFETIYRKRQDRVARNTITGFPGIWDGRCAGWEPAVRPWEFQAGNSPLQLVGHRYEPVTPPEWTELMRRRIGGTVLTVEDDHHGSLSSIPCAEKAVAFFRTGEPATGSCPGAWTS
ncbi:pimeloyl-ACP methyl ester carboxylesterase [Crossiella equi]|uniref:Pimeloyl-ACP methyl ester carboxylesterase n=1 Tax=Crossiella equi TaxID=130796 RepID=A0ABS5ASJ8_9PSEU|nr:alpha/beta fold hydrolase [Crossiella equi]MBP2479539.1 pimeloyl-ACP methyl ester carboxylesterase [Crossiella equi]